MTTKEFVTRTNFYAELDFAARCFTVSIDSVVFSYSYVSVSNKVSGYISDLSTIGDTFSFLDYDSLLFTRFRYSDFIIQLKYFAGFYARLSFHQKDSLIRSHKCDHLINMLSVLK